MHVYKCVVDSFAWLMNDFLRPGNDENENENKDEKNSVSYVLIVCHCDFHVLFYFLHTHNEIGGHSRFVHCKPDTIDFESVAPNIVGVTTHRNQGKSHLLKDFIFRYQFVLLLFTPSFSGWSFSVCVCVRVRAVINIWTKFFDFLHTAEFTPKFSSCSTHSQWIWNDNTHAAAAICAIMLECSVSSEFSHWFHLVHSHSILCFFSS